MGFFSPPKNTGGVILSNGKVMKRKLQELLEDFRDTNIVLVVYVSTCIYYVYLYLLCFVCLYCFVCIVSFM
jgi:hypothetical protein